MLSAWGSGVGPLLRITGLHMPRNPAARPDGLPSDEFARVVATAAVIYWNTQKLGDAVFAKQKAGLETPAEFLTHVSPLGWEHINLTGEYRWPGAVAAAWVAGASRFRLRPRATCSAVGFQAHDHVADAE